jgi:hypothetical protein
MQISDGEVGALDEDGEVTARTTKIQVLAGKAEMSYHKHGPRKVLDLYRSD